MTELKLYEGSSLTAWGANMYTPLTGMKAYDKINVRFDAKPKRNTDIDCYRKETDTIH